MAPRFFGTMPQFTRRSDNFITRAIRFAAPEANNRISSCTTVLTGQLNARHILSPATTIHIERWSRWQSRKAGAAVLTQWGPQQCSQELLEKPALADVPAMQRRRLSPLARVTFQVLAHCSESSAEEPVVFSSVMGELQRTQSLLESIARHEPLSPTAFSLSVHNAIAGLWSQINNNRAPMLALAPCADSPVPALLEAAGILCEGEYTAVNVVYARENYPQFYQPWLDSPPGPCALALRLVASPPAEDCAIRVSLRRVERSQPAVASGNDSALGRLLDHEANAVNVSEPRCDWLLERN